MDKASSEDVKNGFEPMRCPCFWRQTHKNGEKSGFLTSVAATTSNGSFVYQKKSVNVRPQMLIYDQNQESEATINETHG